MVNPDKFDASYMVPFTPDKEEEEEEEEMRVQDARQRIRGCLLGGALGDALGYPIEFMRSAVGIDLMYGAAAPEHLAYANVAPAFISDDTQMTLGQAPAARQR